LQAAGLHPAGPPYARYYTWGETADMEVGIEVDGSPAGEGQVVPGELPGGRAVRTVHLGSYENLRETWSALQEWLAAESLQPAGAPWEVYVTDPNEVPSPADNVTEIYWPIK
jgi:effector-binding domain-containing protein